MDGFLPRGGGGGGGHPSDAVSICILPSPLKNFWEKASKTDAFSSRAAHRYLYGVFVTFLHYSNHILEVLRFYSKKERLLMFLS